MKMARCVSVGLALLFCFGCSAEPGGAAAGAPDAAAAEAPVAVAKPVKTLRLAPSSFEERVSLSGTTKTDADVTLTAQTSGTVERLAARGARLKRGQEIARIDPALARAAVAQASAARRLAAAANALAQDNLRRRTPLFERGVISALEFQQVSAQAQQAEAQLGQAQATLSQAEEQAGYTKIRAPFSGVIEQRFVELGEQLSLGSRVARLVSSRSLKVSAGVPERYVVDIKQGGTITVDFSAYGIPDREATLSFVGSVIDPTSRTFAIEALLDNADGSLKPDMVARVWVTRKKLDGVLTAPLAAVVRDEGGAGVYVIEDDAKGRPTAHHRRVELGAVSGETVVLAAGVKAGEELVVLGQNELTEGDPVKRVGEAEK